jgi:hypothetical protein
MSQFIVLHSYPVLTVCGFEFVSTSANPGFFIFNWFCLKTCSLLYEFGFSSQSLVCHLYPVLVDIVVPCVSSLMIQSTVFLLYSVMSVNGKFSEQTLLLK